VLKMELYLKFWEKEKMSKEMKNIVFLKIRLYGELKL
jgi:hypothetical protein